MGINEVLSIDAITVTQNVTLARCMYVCVCVSLLIFIIDQQLGKEQENLIDQCQCSALH